MKENKYLYFPHDDQRDVQKQMVDLLYDFLRSETDRRLILSGDPGTGKEACMTSQALLALDEGRFDRVIFAIPTDSGKFNILKELNGVMHGKKILKVSSKDVLCEWMKHKDDDLVKTIDGDKCAFLLCKVMGHKCEYKKSGCPYERQKEEIMNADILICDYNYIISPFIRRFSGIEDIMNKNKVLLLIDECHRLPGRAENILSNSLSSNTIERAVMELERFGFSEEQEKVTALRNGLWGTVENNRRKMKKEISDFNTEIGTITIEPRLIDSMCCEGTSLIAAGKIISQKKGENHEGIVSYAGMVGNFIDMFQKYRFSNDGKKSYRIYFIKLRLGTGSETCYIGWSPTAVGAYLCKSLELANKFVLYSGTIYPDKFRYAVGLGKCDVLTPARFESPFLKNRKDIILTKATFRAKNRARSGKKNKEFSNQEFLDEVNADIGKLLISMPGPTAVICTNGWYRALKFPPDILNEPERPEEVNGWLANAQKRNVIRFSPYGRVAQSVDMSFLKSILFIGFPFGSYDKVTQEKIKLLAKSFRGRSGNPKFAAGYSIVIVPACEAVIQSVMRGLRTEKDRLAIVYFDKQFQLNKSLINSQNLSLCNTVDETLAELDKYAKVINHECEYVTVI